MGPLVLIVVAIAMLTAGCFGGDADTEEQPSGDARAFMMGISTLPRELNAESYEDAFRLAGEAGDIVLIQRAPPWEDFLPGNSVSSATADTTAAEKAAIEEHGLRLFFAIDPTDGATGRDRLAGLPASHEGQTFQDEDIQSSFVAFAEYVALNYRPAYLALGVEMNLFLDDDQDELAAFRDVYSAAYRRVKDASPDTKVTVTFQYEDMQALLPTERAHFPSWQLLAFFEDEMDVAAISTYPSLVYAAASEIPGNYYSQLRAFTDKPIVIAEAGFASEDSSTGGHPGDESEQAAFVERLLGEAEDLEMPFVVWFAGWDPTYAEGTAFDLFRHIGLLTSDGSEKLAWPVWYEAASREFKATSAAE